MQKRVKCLQQCYEVATEIMEKPGDEVSFLKRRMTLQHDDRITIETHHKHVDQMCSLLGLNRKLQNRKTPGHSDMDQVDSTGDVSPHAARAFRTCVDILLYLAYDLLHCQHIVRHLSTCPTQPTVTSMTVLKHLVSYLACHEDICVSLKWRRGENRYQICEANGWDVAIFDEFVCNSATQLHCLALISQSQKCHLAGLHRFFFHTKKRGGHFFAQPFNRIARNVAEKLPSPARRLLIQRRHALEGAHAHVFQFHHQHPSVEAGDGYQENMRP